MAIREGKWRCTFCGGVNRGRELACGGCGATRDKDVTFFLEDDAPNVEDAALLAAARAGADWLCQFCQTSNRPAAPRCVQCGAERGTSPSRPVGDASPAPPDPRTALAAPPPRRGPRFPAALLALAAALSCAVCGVFSYFAFRKTEQDVAVAGFEWQRSIEVQAFRSVRESAWEGSVPSGARVVARSREVRSHERHQVGTERVKVGTRDLGNGFFEDVYEQRPVYESRPVYGVKVSYEIERWVSDRTARAAGADQSPRWPDPALRAREREGSRTESYVVRLRGRREYRMELPLERWSSLREGQRLRAVIRGGTRVLSIE